MWRRTMNILNIPKSWNKEQIARLEQLSEAWIGYWCSNADGQPAQYGTPLSEPASVGVVHREDGPLREDCGAGQLHATREPWKWPGSRVWIVALIGETHGDNTKSWGLVREIIGEVMIGDASPEVEIRIGQKILTGAGLKDANLRGANLTGADLRGANLSGAGLSGADLSGANLYLADLRFAGLSRADLIGTDLTGSDLSGADLSRAKLTGTDLTGANLSGANLSRADLTGAIF
jgi:hypothetical protein